MIRVRKLLTATLAAVALASCGHEPTAPVTQMVGSIALSIVGGDGQVGVAGQELPTALKVLALDDKGHPLRGFLVNFRVVTGGGSMFAGASLTDKDGYAQDYWTLGTTLFTPQQVDVVAVDPTTGAKQNFGSFKARGATALSAQLLVTPSSANLGATGSGVPGAATTFTVQNTGAATTGAIATALSGANAADFQIVTNGCAGTTLALSQTCTLTARINSTNAGALAATLTASASPGGSSTSSLTGAVTGTPHLDIAPVSYNFGAVAVGATSGQQSFVVTNTGTAPSGMLNAAAIAGLNPTQFALVKDNCSGVTLAVGATCDVVMSYRPTTTGAHSATLSVTGAPGGTTTANLSGNGNSPVLITVTPTTIDFGSQTINTASTFRIITLQNQSASPTGLLSISITGTNAADFGLGVGTGVCDGSILNPGQTCVVPVAFRPSATGARSATVQMSTTGWSGSAALFGSGAAVITGTPNLVISPSSWDFGSVAVGTQSAPKVFTVTNTGTAASSALLPSLTGPDAASFTAVGSTCVGVQLAPGASCTGTLLFAPTSAGPKTATISLGSVSATVTGMGAAAGASLSITQATATFSAPLGGSSSNTFTILNTGGSMSGVPTISVLGPQAPEFSVVPGTCVAALAPSSSCTLTVVFSPVVNTIATATLSVSASPGGTATSALTGNVSISGPSVTITPNPADFGLAKVGSLATLTLTVTNNGTTVVSPTAPAFATGTGFAVTITTCGPPLIPGATCSISMEFQPPSIATFNGTLTFSWNAGPAIIVPLTGTGSP